MSAGFNRFHETARYGGPTTREAPVTDGDTGEATEPADHEAAFTEAVMRQKEVTKLKKGNLFVRDIAVPEKPVKPGGTVRVMVTVSNGAINIPRWDADRCEANGGDWGYHTQLRVNPAWVAVATETFCIDMALVGTRDMTFEFPFTAPQETGFHNIEVSLFLPNTGVGSGRATRTIEVSEGGEADPEPGGREEEDKDEEDEKGPIEQATVLVGAISVTLFLLVLLLFAAAAT